MTVTAETITLAQIDQLWREACGTGLSDVDPDPMSACTFAANRREDFTPTMVRMGRDVCAAAWNARHGDEQ